MHAYAHIWLVGISDHVGKSNAMESMWTIRYFVLNRVLVYTYIVRKGILDGNIGLFCKKKAPISVPDIFFLILNAFKCIFYTEPGKGHANFV